jgi:molecular chaperone DnaK (HSP70)
LAFDANTPVTVPISLPKDPFSINGKSINIQFAASDLRQIFISRVWDQRLKAIIARTLQRGREELNGAPISVVLLSGGSANIGWLRELLRRDFADELAYAEILQLPDFQEVVAKGLAVECARRFYSQDGDFSSVTYNQWFLEF